MNFKSLLGLVKVLLPTTTQLNCCLLGSELGGSPDRTIAPGITVRKVNGTFHGVYGQLPAHFQQPTFAVLLCPGFNADKYKTAWPPTMKLLLDNNTLSIVSGYSSDIRWTADGAVDDYLLEARYIARTIVPKTRCSAAHPQKEFYYRNAYFLVFRGRRSDATPVAESEILMQQRVRFLTWVGEQMVEDEPGNEFFGRTVLAFVHAYQAGSVSVQSNVGLSELERMAMQFRG